MEIESREKHYCARTELPNRLICDLTSLDHSVILGGVPQGQPSLWPFPNKKLLIARGLMRGLRWCLYFGSTATFGELKLKSKPRPLAIDLTSEVTGWPNTLNLGTNRCVLWRPTCSFFPRSLAQLGAKARGSHQHSPLPLSRRVYRKPLRLARVKAIEYWSDL